MSITNKDLENVVTFKFNEQTYLHLPDWAVVETKEIVNKSK